MIKNYFLLAIIIIFLLPGQSFSQLRGGVRGGINYASFDTDGFNLREFVRGFNLGAFARIEVSDFINIQPELAYSTKGRATEQFSYELGYVDIPVLAIINIYPNFNFQLGPYASYLTDGRALARNNGGGVQVLPNYERNTFRTLDFGATAGAEFDVQRFAIGIRYNYGLTNIFHDISIHHQMNNFGARARNSVWQLYLGIFII
jgi:hypothetical protein